MSAIEENLEARVSKALVPVKKAAIQHAKKGIIRPAVEKTVGLTSYVGFKRALDWIMPHVEKVVLGYVMPYCDKLGVVKDSYDPAKEAVRFYAQRAFKGVEVTDEMMDLAETRFREANNELEAFAAYSRLADSADRIKGPIAIVVEGILTCMGFVPGTAANVVFETVDGVAKAPAYGEMIRKPELNYYAATCGAEEAGTSSVQVVGDLIEMIRTSYMNAALAARRELAEGRIMKDLLDGDYIRSRD